jgi:hypothetical protein
MLDSCQREIDSELSPAKHCYRENEASSVPGNVGDRIKLTEYNVKLHINRKEIAISHYKYPWRITPQRNGSESK